MTTYPKGYEWLGRLGVLPKVTEAGLAIYGTKEAPGPADNPAILYWRDELIAAGVKGLGGYTHDSVAWCGLTMAYVAFRAGKPVIDNPLWALNWAAYGMMIAHNAGTTASPRLVFEKGAQAILGDVLVFSRPIAGGYAGHVGTYVAEDASAYHVLAGNQGDAVSISRVAKARCVAVRRPPVKTVLPASAKPYRVAAGGTLSTNEA
ncbi:C40 family peptidase [Flavisphingomonas formosensis]|uniref:TIGR02594 family protein n=1 Tax=Flavisphingomonas formosensis TaxID=861534 RepID=UPI001E2C36A6|nr:TIGR02594 family protein [Sphingomonas formosensis]